MGNTAEKLQSKFSHIEFDSAGNAIGYIDESPWAPYFSYEELECKCEVCIKNRKEGKPEGFNGNMMDTEFMAKVVKLRIEVGFPMPISSAYRCPHHPREVTKRKNAEQTGKKYSLGSHPRGLAIDSKVFYGEAAILEKTVYLTNVAYLSKYKKLAFPGLGRHQKKQIQFRFIHIDGYERVPNQKTESIWSY